MATNLLCVSVLLPVYFLQFPGTVKGRARQQIKVWESKLLATAESDESSKLGIQSYVSKVLVFLENTVV